MKAARFIRLFCEECYGLQGGKSDQTEPNPVLFRENGSDGQLDNCSLQMAKWRGNNIRE